MSDELVPVPAASPEPDERKRRARAVQVEQAQRREQALKLRLAGASYADIGKHLGITEQSAHGMVKRVLANTARRTAEVADEVRALEVRRLDALLASQWSDAMKGDEQKVDRVLRIMARRAALLGLDAPTKTEVTHDIDAEIERIMAALAASGQGAVAGAFVGIAAEEQPERLALDAAARPADGGDEQPGG